MDFAADPQRQHDGPAYSRMGITGSANRGIDKSSPSAGHRPTRTGRCASSAAVLIGSQPSVPHPPQRQGEDRCLCRRAAQWAMAILENRTPAFSSYTTKLRQVFDHPVQSGKAASKILSLCQGSSSIIATPSIYTSLRPGAAGMTPSRERVHPGTPQGTQR